MGVTKVTIKKKPYLKAYPAAARMLIDEGMANPPRQKEVTGLKWAEGLHIAYTLNNMTPANFRKYSDTLLLLAFQEASRYGEYKYTMAGFDVKLGRLKKGRDLPEVATFQAALHPDPEIMVWGEQALGYEVPQKYFLINKVEDILDLARRYLDKVSKQNPYKVIRLFIDVRQPIITYEEG